MNILIMVVLTFMFVFVVYGLYNPISVSEIMVCSDAIDNPIKIALISDLHSCKYGDGQAKLIDAIDKQRPDLICLVGDIFDDKILNDNTEIFIAEISEKYPCYYVTGNHEFRAGTQAFQEQMEILEKYEVEEKVPLFQGFITGRRL